MISMDKRGQDRKNNIFIVKKKEPNDAVGKMTSEKISGTNTCTQWWRGVGGGEREEEKKLNGD